MTPAEASEINWRVYVILDPRHLHPDNDLVGTARAALRGGAGVLQLRDKESSGRELVRRARELQAACDEFDATFVVNDRLDVALAAGADGVHLGPEDIPIRDARRIAPDLLIGGSSGSAQRAADLQEEGVDYLGCGAVYDAGPSKPDASNPRGPDFLARINRAVDIPVVGIGGITADTARAVVEAGAGGIAVIRAAIAQNDPESAVRALLEAVS